MAHNLNFNEQTAKHSVLGIKEKAWHNLGKVIQNNPTSAGAITNSGLGHEVEK